MRAASYLFSAASGGDSRLAAEALEAMERTRAELSARRHLWAGREEPSAWPGRGALLLTVRTVLGKAVAALCISREKL